MALAAIRRGWSNNPSQTSGPPTAAAVGKRRQPGFEREPRLIADIACQFATLAPRRIGRGEHIGHLVGAIRDECPLRVFEQHRVGRAAFAGIVEQDEGTPFRHRPQPLPQAPRLSRDSLTAPAAAPHRRPAIIHRERARHMGEIFLGLGANGENQHLRLGQANRHGLIAGATRDRQDRHAAGAGGKLLRLRAFPSSSPM